MLSVLRSSGFSFCLPPTQHDNYTFSISSLQVHKPSPGIDRTFVVVFLLLACGFARQINMDLWENTLQVCNSHTDVNRAAAATNVSQFNNEGYFYSKALQPCLITSVTSIHFFTLITTHCWLYLTVLCSSELSAPTEHWSQARIGWLALTVLGTPHGH